MATGRELLERRVGIVGLKDLADVSEDTFNDGDVPVWSDADGKFIPGAGGSGGGGGYTNEQAQDAVGGIMTDTADIDFTYSDATPSISAVLTTTGVVAGLYSNANVEIDAKGRVIFIENGASSPNLDGGMSDSTYGGIDAVDGGGA